MWRVNRSGSPDDRTPEVRGTDDLSAAGDLSRAVARAQRGDEEAFRTLYRAVQPGLLRYLTVLVGTEAEDVASEAWLQIARDLATFTGDGDGFRGWAATVARHRAMDHLRRQRRRPDARVPLEELFDLAAAGDTALDALDSVGTSTALAMIARLPRDQAEAVLLRVVVGLDAQAAGAVLGKRPGTVRVAAHRGLKKLAALIEQADRMGRSPGRPVPRGAVPPRRAGGSHVVTPAIIPAAGVVAGRTATGGTRGKNSDGRVTRLRTATLKDMR